MAYDESLAHRIREAIETRPGITEKRMFGGIAFLSNARMFIGIVRNELMVRVGADAAPALLELEHVRPMDFTGRPMAGYLYVAPPACETVDQVREWADRALAFVATLKK